MSFILAFTPTANFWLVNPQFTIKEPFKSLYKEDRSKDKKDTSKLMWFVAFGYDPSPVNVFRNVPTKEKHEVIGSDYMEDPKFYDKNKAQLDKLIDAFLANYITPSQRHLMEWESLVEKRTNFIKNQEYDLATFEDLDKMAIGTEKILNTFKKIKEEILKEQNSDGAAKGDRELSLSDKGDI